MDSLFTNDAVNFYLLFHVLIDHKEFIANRHAELFSCDGQIDHVVWFCSVVGKCASNSYKYLCT